MLGWLKANNPADFNQNVLKAVKWLGKQRGGYGGFGSTQSTILALKALIAYTQEHKKAVEPGDLRLSVNDAQVASLGFSGHLSDPLTLQVPDQFAMPPGNNKVRVEVTGKSVFPYTM